MNSPRGTRLFVNRTARAMRAFVDQWAHGCNHTHGERNPNSEAETGYKYCIFNILRKINAVFRN